MSIDQTPSPQPITPSVARILIAAPQSGSGKTTVAMGLMAALRSQGHQVAPFKVGPDYVDPGYHAIASGRPGRNLDIHLCGEDRMAPLLVHGSSSSDIAVIEGVMGLFDGKLDAAVTGSSAHLARLTQTPVIVVLDSSRMAATAGAVIAGLTQIDPDLMIAGVILNRVGSSAHRAAVTTAVESVGVPVIGALPSHRSVTVPGRHLGLIPVAERPELAAAIDAASDLITAHVDLDAVTEIARSAPELNISPWDPIDQIVPIEGRPVVAVAAGAAFTFRYQETDELLAAAGCEVVEFDPLTDPLLPDHTAGLYLGGGFPEEWLGQLSANASLRAQIRSAIAAGLPTYAEGGGLAYLGGRLDGVPLVGALDIDTAMTPSLTMGYRQPTLAGDSLIGEAGTTVHSHEFHRTAVVRSDLDSPAWQTGDGDTGVSWPSDTSASLVASYHHLHWAGQPEIVQRFVRSCAEFSGTPLHQPRPHVVAPIDLGHHGDRDLADGLIDMAVNIRQTAPGWLIDEIQGDADGLVTYPDSSAAHHALADHHGVSIDSVLPTAGGAEGFTLIARAIPTRWPVVVHPQFTEPEIALTTVGHRVTRHLLTEPFTFDPAALSDRFDLVVVGNPTNPTGVLHRREDLLALRRPGRVVVIDEAFMDATIGETESVIGDDLDGLIVVRSATKTWGLAGLRVGYLVGDPHLIAACQAHQPPWSVNSLALRALVALTSDRACQERDQVAADGLAQRQDLVDRLTIAGFRSIPGHAPFVLIHTEMSSPRQALADQGFAVRRGETFPGLDSSWIRVAVRSPEIHEQLVTALARARDREATIS